MQCDRCELWFHMKCIGVTENDITDDTDYICVRCRTPHATPTHTPGAPTPQGQSKVTQVLCTGLYLR